MKILKYISGFFLVAVVLFSSCESMEDTYDEYTKGGKERYLGKVGNLKIQEGHKRFVFTWENSNDPNIKETKIKWFTESDTGSMVVPRGIDSCSTPTNLKNDYYNIVVTSVSKFGKESLPTTLMGKPYTADHEGLIAYRGLSRKYYFFHNTMYMRFADLGKEVKKITISFTRDGQEVVEDVTEGAKKSGFVNLKGIDINKDVHITSSIKLEDCIDEIPLVPEKLEINNFEFNQSFKKNLQLTYGLGPDDITFDWVNSVEVLYFDHDIRTIEDILVFGNLKKVVLGANRHVNSKQEIIHGNSDFEYGIIEEFKNSISSLNALRQNDPEFTCEVYSNLFFMADSLDWAVDKDLLPPKNVDRLMKWNWTASVTSENPFLPFTSSRNNIEKILDTRTSTFWKPNRNRNDGKVYEYEIVVDTKKVNTINGFEFTQPLAAMKMSLNDRVDILVSIDGENYSKLPNYIDTRLGRSLGEQTFLDLVNPIEARYIKIIIKDKANQGIQPATSLAGFDIY